MIYRYRAWAPGGELVTGEMEASARSVAERKLQEQGYLIESLTAGINWKLDVKLDFSSNKLGLRQISMLFNQLSMMIKGGVPVLQCLQVLAGHYKGKPAQTLAKMAIDVEHGQTLSQALVAFRSSIPRVALHVISVSELAGELEKGLSLLAKQFDSEDQIRRKVMSALMYPVVVLLMTFGLAAFMIGFIVPQYSGMFADLGSELPVETRILLGVSGFVQKYFFLILVFLVLFAFGFVYAMNRSESFRLNVHAAMLKVPVVGPLIRNRESARYCRVLSTMLKSGVPVLTAAQTGADSVQNAALADRLVGVGEQISMGSSIGQSIKASGVLPPIMAELLAVGEMIGETDTSLEQVATFCEADVNQTVDRLTSILEPVLILTLGAIVLSVVYPLLLPMFDIYGKL